MPAEDIRHPEKAAHCLQKEVGQNIKDKKTDKRVRDRDPSRGGSLKKRRSFQVRGKGIFMNLGCIDSLLGSSLESFDPLNFVSGNCTHWESGFTFSALKCCCQMYLLSKGSCPYQLTHA